MLDRLRAQFIVITMALVTTVVITSFAGIVAIEYQHGIKAVHEALDAGIGHDAQAQDKDGERKPPDDDRDDAEDRDDEHGDRDEEGYLPPRIGGPARQGGFIPVAVYAISNDGTATMVSSRTNASIDESIESEVCKTVLSSSDGYGSLPVEGLYYKKMTTEDGALVAFADMTSASGWRRTAAAMSIIGVAALGALLVITVFLARWALRPVEKAWRAQKQFVADASHELKTPLTVMLANTSILLRHPDHTIAEESQWLESTRIEGERMQSLIGDMLTLAKVESSGAVPLCGPVDISEMTDGLILQFESIAFERSIDLTCDIEGDIIVSGDVGKLEKMVATLLENACKYAGADGQVHVVLACSARSGLATLAIRNSGDAIPAADLPHIFDRFYRSNEARTHTDDDMSFGLGLAIARSIARAHHGDIKAESTAADGTVFTVTLPLRK